MISNLELRHVIETGFLPTKCICTIDPYSSMTVQLINPDTQKEELTVAGIDLSRFETCHDIATLVAELKEEARIRLVEPLRASSHSN